MRASTSARSAGSSQTGPTGRPVSAASGLVAELKTTLSHWGPRASTMAWHGRPRTRQQVRERHDLAHRRRLRLEGTEPGVTGGVEADDARLGHRARGEDRAADDARHQLGDDLLVAQPVLHAGHRRVGEDVGAGRHGRAGVLGLGGDDAEVAGRHVGGVGRGVDGRGEARARPVTRRPCASMASTWAAYGSTAQTSTSSRRARWAAYRLPIAPQPTTQTRTVMRARPGRSAASSAHRNGAGPPTPRPATTRPSTRTGRPPDSAETRYGQQVVGRGKPLGQVAAGCVEQGGRRRDGLGDVRAAGRGVVHRVVLHRLAAPVDDADRDGAGPRPRPGRSRVARARGPSRARPAAWRSGRAPCRRPSGGSSRQAPNAAVQRARSSPCWPTYSCSSA